MRFRSIIKSRWAFAVVLIACLLPAVYFAFGGASHADVSRAETAAQGLDEYRYDLRFLPDEMALYGTMELDFTNRTDNALESIVLRTYANAYQREENSPAAIDYFYDGSYKNGFSAGSITIEGLWWNDAIITNWRYSDDAQTVLHVPIDALATGESGQMLLRFKLKIPNCAHRFGYSEGVWQFGNALPTLSLFENGAWRTDPYCAVGDPFVSACANYTVSILAPEGFTCAAGAAVTTEKTDDGLRFRTQGHALRDFAFALSREWVSASEKVSGTRVTAYAFDQKTAQAAAKYGAQAVKTYSKLYGDYAWPQLTICMVDFPAGGMEYAGLFFISRAYSAPDLRATMELVIAHEAAHQWFYALVGSDQYNQPWQDEALSEFAMLQYAKARYGQSAYENLLYTRVKAPMQENIVSRITPGSPVDHFGSYDDYSTVVYGRGAALIEAIDTLTGNANAFLRAYCDEFAFSFATRNDFERCLNRWSGMDLSPLVLDYIDTYIN